jgi:hypothetical protein
MTLENTPARGMALRASDGWSISEGVPERKSGVEKAIAALLSLLAWLRRPPDVPDYLRADVGLPPRIDPLEAVRSTPGYITVTWRRLN